MNYKKAQEPDSKTNKNICLIIDTLIGGGAERVVLTLADTLQKLGHHVNVMIFHNRIHYSLDRINFKIHIIEREHPVRFLRRYKRAKDVQEKISELGIKVDLTVSNSLGVHKVCKQAKLPNLYFCIHNTTSVSEFNRYKNRKGWNKFRGRISRYFRSTWIKKLYKKQNLIAVSNGVKDDALKFGIRPKSIRTIYNPFDFNDIRQQAKSYRPDEKDYIVHVGSFSKQKRHDILIKAYHQSGIDEQLLLLGDNENADGERMKQLAADLNLQNKVIFKGFNKHPYPYIKNAKALVLSSDFEGLPTVLIEALILGVPVVSTDCPSGPSEILVDDMSEFLSPVGDVGALAINIRKIIKTPVKATEANIESFCATTVAKQYLALCKDD
ncbi:Glycosyl transferase, group 1 [uncultured Candidatus Thioglobus sp.]|nr:Glycosyl transferase, group 1 [uncultured Candidatus Thioglobus sp.]